jgi:hypothetical protein
LSLDELRALEGSLMRQIEANVFNNRLNGGDSMAGLRSAGMRNFRKRNYNLDHLARMNFRRSSFRANKFNNRHILGGI